MEYRRGLGLGAVLIALVVVTGCDRHGPISEATKRKYYGDAFIYPGAPFYCLYVGLETNETGLFATNFWRFAAERYELPTPGFQATV